MGFDAKATESEDIMEDVDPMLDMEGLIKNLAELDEQNPGATLLVSTEGPLVNYDAFHRASSVLTNIQLQFLITETVEEKRKRRKGKWLTLREIADLGEWWFAMTSRRPKFCYLIGTNNASEDDAKRLKRLFCPAKWIFTLAWDTADVDTAKRFFGRLIERGYCFV